MAKSEESSTDLVAADEAAERFPALIGESGAEFRAMLEENLGGEGLRPGDLDRIKMPAGGGLAWEVPTIDGEDSVKELEGIIVTWQSPRSYWRESLDDTGGGQPPDCASTQGVFGDGEYGPGSDENPSGRCDQCPMNEWGSADDGRGKACKEQRLLYLLRENSILPVLVALPPTSIQPLRKFMLRLASEGIPYYAVTTKLGLNRVSGEKFTYSVADPKLGKRLSPEVAAAAKEYGEKLKAMASTVAASVARGEDAVTVEAEVDTEE